MAGKANDQADPQPGQRPPDCSETQRVTNDDQTETLTAVGSSALFGDLISPPPVNEGAGCQLHHLEGQQTGSEKMNRLTAHFRALGIRPKIRPNPTTSSKLSRNSPHENHARRVCAGSGSECAGRP